MEEFFSECLAATVESSSPEAVIAPIVAASEATGAVIVTMSENSGMADTTMGDTVGAMMTRAPMEQHRANNNMPIGNKNEEANIPEMAQTLKWDDFYFEKEHPFEKDLGIVAVFDYDRKHLTKTYQEVDVCLVCCISLFSCGLCLPFIAHEEWTERKHASKLADSRHLAVTKKGVLSILGGYSLQQTSFEPKEELILFENIGCIQREDECPGLPSISASHPLIYLRGLNNEELLSIPALQTPELFMDLVSAMANCKVVLPGESLPRPQRMEDRGDQVETLKQENENLKRQNDMLRTELLKQQNETLKQQNEALRQQNDMLQQDQMKK